MSFGAIDVLVDGSDGHQTKLFTIPSLSLTAVQAANADRRHMSRNSANASTGFGAAMMGMPVPTMCQMRRRAVIGAPGAPRP